MTTGSWISDHRFNAWGHLHSVDQLGNVIYDGPYGLGTFGSYRSKSWSGGDAPKVSLPPRKQRRISYTTVDRKGRTVQKHYFLRDPSVPRKKVAKGFHAYTVTCVNEVSEAASKNSIGSDGASSSVTGVSASFLLGGFPYLPFPSWTANDDINLLNRLAEQMKGGDFNMSVFLGEGHQALNMITDSAKRLVRGYTAARKGDFALAFRTLTGGKPRSFWEKKTHFEFYRDRKRASFAGTSKTVSERWLELQYGWRPLINDMYNGAELFANRVHAPFVARRVARLSKTKVAKPSDWGGYVFPAHARSTVRKQIVAYVYEEQSLPQFLGLTNPELVAWELLPFSFVFDWFVPFGDFLKARAYFTGLSGTFITTKTYTSTLRGLQSVGYEGPPSVSIEVSGELFGERKFVTRSVGYTLDVPMPEVKPLAKALSVQHCLNAVALLGTLSLKH